MKFRLTWWGGSRRDYTKVYETDADAETIQETIYEIGDEGDYYEVEDLLNRLRKKGFYTKVGDKIVDFEF